MMQSDREGRGARNRSTRESRGSVRHDAVITVRVAAAAMVLAGAGAYAGAPRLEAASAKLPRSTAVVLDAGASDLVAREVAALRGPERPRDETARVARQDSLAASEAEYQGWKTFHVYCYRCHGVDALGSDLAPNLRHSVSPAGSVTHDVFMTTVKEGRLAKGMPSWKALLTDEQIENLYAYVKARSEKRLAAGRPHRKSPQG